MIDLVTIVYHNYDLLDLQVYNFTKRFKELDYRVLVIDNTPDISKKSVILPSNFIYVPRENPNTYEFDGISHGKALDFGIEKTQTEIIGIFDSDFFFLNNDVLKQVTIKINEGFSAIGTEYNDGADTQIWVNKNPKNFENIPCCFGAFYKRNLALSDTWVITPEECKEGADQGFVEVGYKIRKLIINNSIKTLNWKTFSTSYGNCYFKDELGKIVGIHYVAGSHRRWNNSSKEEIKNIIDRY